MAGLIALIEPHFPKGEGGRPAHPLMAMLPVILMQDWFGYSEPAMEEALCETICFANFGLSLKPKPLSQIFAPWILQNFVRLPGQSKKIQPLLDIFSYELSPSSKRIHVRSNM